MILNDLGEIILGDLNLIGVDLRRQIVFLYHKDLLAFFVDVDLQIVGVAVITTLKGVFFWEAC